jgi:hypothetical protein
VGLGRGVDHRRPAGGPGGEPIRCRPQARCLTGRGQGYQRRGGGGVGQQPLKRRG